MHKHAAEHQHLVERVRAEIIPTLSELLAKESMQTLHGQALPPPPSSSPRLEVPVLPMATFVASHTQYVVGAAAMLVGLFVLSAWSRARRWYILRHDVHFQRVGTSDDGGAESAWGMRQLTTATCSAVDDSTDSDALCDTHHGTARAVHGWSGYERAGPRRAQPRPRLDRSTPLPGTAARSEPHATREAFGLGRPQLTSSTTTVHVLDEGVCDDGVVLLQRAPLQNLDEKELHKEPSAAEVQEPSVASVPRTRSFGAVTDSIAGSIAPYNPTCDAGQLGQATVQAASQESPIEPPVMSTRDEAHILRAPALPDLALQPSRKREKVPSKAGQKSDLRASSSRQELEANLEITKLQQQQQLKDEQIEKLKSQLKLAQHEAERQQASAIAPQAAAANSRMPVGAASARARAFAPCNSSGTQVDVQPYTQHQGAFSLKQYRASNEARVPQLAARPKALSPDPATAGLGRRRRP